MTQVHFTLETEDIQSLIDQSVKDIASKQILQTVFNQLMDEYRTDYIQSTNYERSDDR